MTDFSKPITKLHVALRDGKVIEIKANQVFTDGAWAWLRWDYDLVGVLSVYNVAAISCVRE